MNQGLDAGEVRDNAQRAAPAVFNDAALDALVESQYARAVGLAWRLTGADRATAEEITQDALLRCHMRIQSLRDPEKLRQWFYKILIRQAANHRRWRAVRVRLAHLVGNPVEPADASTGRDPFLRARIAQAMDTLSGGQREVFALVYLEGLTVEQTAALLNKAPGTVKSHLHRALVRLRAHLKDVMDDAMEIR